jgi:hypothetical protein
VGEKWTGSYKDTNGAASCEATEYAKANGAYVSSSNKFSWWWLRSPGSNQSRAASVGPGGYVYIDGDYVSTTNRVVRPALWISL